MPNLAPAGAAARAADLEPPAAPQAGRAAAVAAAASPWRAEFGATLRLALPLAATQLGQVLIHGTETLLLARLGPAPLASVTLAWTLFFAAFVCAMGVVQSTAAAIAQARGAGRPDAARLAVRRGLWLAVAVTLPMAAALWHGDRFLVALGQDPALAAGARTYLRASLFGLPFAAAFVVLRNWASAYDRSGPVTAITWAVVLLNAPVSAALIFGFAGLPPLGLLGAGIGAALAWTVMCLALLAWCARSPELRGGALFRELARRDSFRFLRLLRIGLPIGAAMLLETSLFAGSALLMGRIGTAELAAHQVAIQLASTTFMIPLGISIAATIRIGYAAGAGDAAGVRRAGWLAAALGAGFMGACGILYATAGPWLAGLFFAGGGPDAAAAAAIAARLILVAALFQLVDGLQVIGIAALRGLNDTAVPMLLAGLGYGAIGLPACALLGFWTPLGAVGIWLGLALALLAVAGAMLARFALLTRPGPLTLRVAAARAAAGARAAPAPAAALAAAGLLAAAAVAAVPGPAEALGARPAFAPFFDGGARDASDPSPAAPALGRLDEAVVGLCGGWGSRPSRAAFRALLDRPEFAGEVAEVAAALGSRPGGRESDAAAALKARLVDLWWRSDGFVHVFCGEPAEDGIGGLHFAPRFLWLQEQGLAGLAAPGECRRVEVRAPVYTLGVRFRTPDGGTALDCPTGYALDLDAKGLLVEATRAAAAFLARGGSGACLTRTAGGYDAVLVAERGGIVTFYPDLTPACPRGAPPATCRCGG